MTESEPKKPLIQIDPKELAPMGAGLFLGLLILAGFLLLALALGLPLIPEQWDIPKQ